MRFECSNCKTAYSISDERIKGKTIKIVCRNCGQPVEIRDPTGPKVSLPPRAESPAPASAPPPLPKKEAAPAPAWYVGLDGKEEGPLSREEIAERVRRGSLGADHFAWREGMADWIPIEEVPELAGLFQRPTHPPPPARKTTDVVKLPTASGRDRSRDATLFDSGQGGVALPPTAGPEEEEAEEAGSEEEERRKLLERVHRKRQQARADRQADRIADYFFESTHLLGETANLPPPPVAGSEQLAEKLEQEAESERACEPADPLAALVKTQESLEEISKITKVLADQARLGARDTGKRLGVTLAVICGIVGMLTGFIALSISQGWFSAIGSKMFGITTPTQSESGDFSDLNLSPEESRRLREQLWLERRKAAGGSVMQPAAQSKSQAVAETQPSEREKELLAFYQQEAERKREVIPHRPADLLNLPAPAELPLSIGSAAMSLPPGAEKQEVVPQGPERKISGELSEAQIKAVIDSRYPYIKKCLEKQLKRDARISGKLLVTALVNPDGKVSKVSIPTEKFRGTLLEECLTKEVARWLFPSFSGPPQEVTFPLLLSAQMGG